jgi:uncharacterized protein (TIGR00266 family)
MDIEILYRPSYSMAVAKLKGHEQILAEAGSLVGMSAGVTIQTQATGGFLKSLARSFLTKESFFQNTYQAPAEGGELCLAPSLPGDILVVDMKQEILVVQSGSYLASEDGISVDAKWGGAKTFFASEGLIMLSVAGSGKLVLSSYGAIHEKTLKAGETYFVDTGHLVAFSEGVGFKIRRVGGLKSMIFSGEGFVVELTGPGRVLMQTRSSQSFLDWILANMPTSRQGGPGGARNQ